MALLVICVVFSKIAVKMAAILDLTQISNFLEKLEKSNIYFARVEKYDTIKRFPALFCICI